MNNRDTGGIEWIGLGMGGATANETGYFEAAGREFAGNFAAHGTSGAHDKDGHGEASREGELCGVSHRLEELATDGAEGQQFRKI